MEPVYLNKKMSSFYFLQNRDDSKYLNEPLYLSRRGTKPVIPISPSPIFAHFLGPAGGIMLISNLENKPSWFYFYFLSFIEMVFIYVRYWATFSIESAHFLKGSPLLNSKKFLWMPALFLFMLSGRQCSVVLFIF